ncbi:MAG: TSCPD domain-containing protein [Planctomycetota bacterium]|jgi:hypothetical protein
MYNNRDLSKEVSRPSFTVKVMTPDGVMFVTVVEEMDIVSNTPAPVQILIAIGKTGSAIAAWANMSALLVSTLLQEDVSISDIIMRISNILSDGISEQKTGIEIRSGPEGLQYALTRYNEDRQNRL